MIILVPDCAIAPSGLRSAVARKERQRITGIVTLIEDKFQNDHRIPGLRYRSIRATNSRVARKKR